MIATKPLTLLEALESAQETLGLELGPNVLSKTPAVFREYFPGQTFVLVADENTWAVAGEIVASYLAQDGLNGEQPFIFRDTDLYAEIRFVERLEASLKKHHAIPIAVGSGVINDLTKLAAHRAGRSYLCVATAASMDGYTAFGASITYLGSKQTFNCPAPTTVIADTNVIRFAPPAMTASGYADMVAKITAGADWLLADALGAEPLHEQAWNIVQGRLRESLSDPAGARAGNEPAIYQLAEGLMLGGFGMQAARSSRPASGAEHQFSHLWDMQHHTHQGEAPSHGFKVGIGTLAVTAFYDYFLSLPLETLDLDHCCAQWSDAKTMEARVRQTFAHDDFVEKAVEEALAKHPTREALRAQLEILKAKWPTLRSQLRDQLMPFAELKQKLQLVGAPTEPEQIGITRERLRASFDLAYFIRRRFTILDLALRTGTLSSGLDHVFGPQGPWPSAISTTAAH